MSPLVRVKMPQDQQIKDPTNLYRMDRIPVTPHVYTSVNGQVMRVDLNREVLLSESTIAALTDAGATVVYTEEGS